MLLQENAASVTMSLKVEVIKLRAPLRMFVQGKNARALRRSVAISSTLVGIHAEDSETKINVCHVWTHLAKTG